jgi:uncharacterized coiled-coil DUF342 family protein
MEGLVMPSLNQGWIVLDELVERLHGELADVINEIESLRKEREGINARIRERLVDRIRLERMLRASTTPKGRRSRHA